MRFNPNLVVSYELWDNSTLQNKNKLKLKRNKNSLSRLRIMFVYSCTNYFFILFNLKTLSRRAWWICSTISFDFFSLTHCVYSYVHLCIFCWKTLVQLQHLYMRNEIKNLPTSHAHALERNLRNLQKFRLLLKFSLCYPAPLNKTERNI